jgi:diadenosine tetraphosphatase ApaH/serine/threonine PP2A family protein phosphatase
LLQAIVSDIHSNLEAMKVVLDDLLSKNITDIVCLGDIIGYGPNPRECVDLATAFRVWLLGNHEEALMEELRTHGFNPKATGARDWTYSQLDIFHSSHKEENKRRWDFIGEMHQRHEQDDALFVHGSPCEPTREYIYPREATDPEKMGRVFAAFEHICFVGHTHIPGVFTEDLKFLTPTDVDGLFRIPKGRKVLINVGSVGQPRDYDPRACYLIWDGKAVVWRRLEYDCEKTAQKIFATNGLDRSLGSRLRTGR